MPRVILLRHGETPWSLSGQHTGRTDLRLTPHGEELVAQLGPPLVGDDPTPEQGDNSALITPHHLGYVFVSPRGRAQRTLQLLLQHLPAEVRAKIPLPEVRDDVREWDYGLFEGRTPAEARAFPGHENWDIWRDGTPDDPADASMPGESAEHMTERIDGMIRQIRLIQRAAAHGYLNDRGIRIDADKGHRTADILLVAHGHYIRYVEACCALRFFFCC